MDKAYDNFLNIIVYSFVYIFIIFTLIFFVYESLIIFSDNNFNELKITLITFWVLVLIFMIILIFSIIYNYSQIWIPFYFILLIIVSIVLCIYSIIYQNICILCTCVILIIDLSFISFLWITLYFNNEELKRLGIETKIE
uniref:Uncharacterized protein n=1 Tax=viral metagenome TaxID=1070528 RepID=A0A6C0ADZ4_9ZZZZ